MKENMESMKFHYSNGNVVDVRMSVAGSNVVYVRVFDLPPEVSDNDISVALKSFGTVGTMVREKFPVGLGLDHLSTGIRGAYVEMEKDIPPALEIGIWKVRIFHDGLRGRCFLCNMEGHRKDSCPQRKTGKPQIGRKQGPVTYADIVGSGPAPSFNGKDIVEMDPEIIEVQDEEIPETEGVQRLNSEYRMNQLTEAEQKAARQEQAAAELTRFVTRIQEAVNKQTADERRAQFAASGSIEMLRPKKTARKS